MLEINGATVPAGNAVQFAIDATGPNVRHRWQYSLSLKFVTSLGQHIEAGLRVEIV